MASDETQARIIDAAGPIFAEKGYRDATVREICDAAGVGLASVNYHFGDKQHLYVRVVEHAYEHLQSSRVPRLDQVPLMPPGERLAEWVSRLVRKVLIDRGQSWQDSLFTREVQDPTPACEEFLRERVRADVRPLLEVYDAVMPTPASDTERWQFVFSVLGQALFYDTYRRMSCLVMGDDAESPAFTPKGVAEHITRFCKAALGLSRSSASFDAGARS